MEIFIFYINIATCRQNVGTAVLDNKVRCEEKIPPTLCVKEGGGTSKEVKMRGNYKDNVKVDANDETNEVKVAAEQICMGSACDWCWMEKTPETLLLC